MTNTSFADVDLSRRKNMAAIKGKDTDPELKVRSTLHRRGYRFAVNVTGLPGRPDLAFTKRKRAVFVHGCFWHSHQGCKAAHTPKTRRGYWDAKLQRNRQRDAENLIKLQALGWSVHIVWECEVRQAAWVDTLTGFLGPPRAM